MYNPHVEVRDQLDLEALSKCKLNDFEAFKQLLFTDEERELVNKWDKFISSFECDDTRVCDLEEKWYCAVPFDCPKTIVENQINHFVTWGCIAHIGSIIKPERFFNYNTGHFIFSSPFCSCWACNYTIDFACKPNCVWCPIWKQQYTGQRCMCEPEAVDVEIQKDILDYYYWDHYIEYEGPETVYELAKSVQYKIWTDRKEVN